MAKAIIPVSGVNDQLGTPDKPFAAAYITTIYGPNGAPVAFIPIDASAVQTGVLNANRIDRLNASTMIVQIAQTILEIAENAKLGAEDPIERINGGAGGLDGSKIADLTVAPNALSKDSTLDHAFKVGDGAIQSDYVPQTSGWILSKTSFEVNLAAAIWRGIVAGVVNIANAFTVDINGNAKFGDTLNIHPHIHGMNSDASEWWGSATYPDGPTQFDPFGNIYISDSPDSQSSIDLGAINARCGLVQAVPGGGQWTGNVTLQAFTRGATIYYTTDGNDPRVSGAIYAAPFSVAPSPSITLRAVAYKLGVWGNTSSWVFTSAADHCSAPAFTILPGFYTSFGGIRNLSFNTTNGTAGATIKYTLDGSTPGPSNGIVYVNPFQVGPGHVILKAIAEKGGLTDSAVVTGEYYFGVGGGGGGSPGGGHLL